MVMTIRSMREVDEALKPYLTVAAETTGKDITLQRQKRLMTHLGNPEAKLKIIHIAGTSGKTSTSYYIATLLQKSGQKIGLTVSPHVDTLAERVQINGHPLTVQKFCSFMEEYLALIEDISETPSWFEVMVGFAFWVFARENVDYAVVETGLGGLQDGTNVATRADKVCVITDIGYDHMNILGDRLGAIAHQKIGIVHPENTAIMYEQSDEIMQVVRFWVSQQENAELLTFDQAKLQISTKMQFEAGMPMYQHRNWLLAYATFLFLVRRDSIATLSQKMIKETQTIAVPGRMDCRLVQGKTIIMDGAHNAQKMTAFIESFKARYPATRATIVIGLKLGKEIKEVAPLLRPIANCVIATEFQGAQDLPIKAYSAKTLAGSLRKAKITEVIFTADASDAYQKALQCDNEIVIITGSFYLLAQLRAAYLELR